MSTANLLLGVALLAGAELAVRGHLSANLPAFHAGLLLAAAGVAALAVRARRAGRRVLPLAAGAAALAGLSFAELALDALLHETARQAADPTWSFARAAGNPAAYERWRAAHAPAWRLLSGVGADRTASFEPGDRLRLDGVEVVIGPHGFRGGDAGPIDDDAYRIFVLGGSSTFGATLLPEDRPWPEVLEARIRETWRCAVPVRVLNAGLPGQSLASSRARLERDVFPGRVDLIVTHHGPDGFAELAETVPEARFEPSHATAPRASRAAAALERAVERRSRARRWRLARQALPTAPDVRKTDYASEYRRILVEARARGVAVALLSFDMAVDLDSPEAAIRFYEGAVPRVREWILANRLHDRLVRQMAVAYAARSVDTSENLSGAYDDDAWIGPTHLSQLGRERLAANVLEGLRDLLEREPRPGCTPSQRGDGNLPMPPAPSAPARRAP
jgi:hypothetical protein